MTYIPFLKQTPLGSQSLKTLQEDVVSGARHMKAYPSQKILAPGSITQSQPQPREGKAKGSPSPSEKAKQEYMPYQVQLMSLANMNAANHHDETSRISSQMAAGQHNQQPQMPNKVKLKQERIIQRLERKQKKDQGAVIVAPQGPGVPSVIRKSRNPDKLHNTDAGSRKSVQNTRPGSGNSRRGSWDSAKGAGKTSAYKEGVTSLGELADPVEQVKLLPLKARLIFKKAMKELDSVDLVNSSQLPMSRPRIRAILKQMKDNLEQGAYPDERSLSKGRADKANTPNNERLLQGLGRQAERDLFGMLIREKKQKKLNLEKNEEMRQLYEERMQRKKAQFRQMQARQEQRQKIRDDNGYLSASSSEDFANSFDVDEGRGAATAEKAAGKVQTERQQNDYVTTLLSSERPSSAEQVFGSVTSRKDVDRYNQMRSLSTKRKKKQEQMVLEELLALCVKPQMNGNQAAGNFYSKFQNLDKIIQKEDNELACTTIQEQFEQRELEEEQRMMQITEGHQRGNSTLISPSKTNASKHKIVPASTVTTTNYHTNDDLNARMPRSGKSSFLSTPGKSMPHRNDVNKSPIIEYLKQA